jgi:histidine triad (HIT) family protein
MSCLFCRIVSGDIPATRVFENERLVAFNDISPAAPLHVLIVPREHIATLNAIDERHDVLVGEMVRTAAALAAERGYAERGFRTVFNCNADGGQTVFHLHLHVLAGRTLAWPPG